MIFNGATGSSWIFKRFNRFQINVTDKSYFKTVVFGYSFFQHTSKKNGVH